MTICVCVWQGESNDDGGGGGGGGGGGEGRRRATPMALTLSLCAAAHPRSPPLSLSLSLSPSYLLQRLEPPVPAHPRLHGQHLLEAGQGRTHRVGPTPTVLQGALGRVVRVLDVRILLRDLIVRIGEAVVWMGGWRGWARARERKSEREALGVVFLLMERTAPRSHTHLPSRRPTCWLVGRVRVSAWGRARGVCGRAGERQRERGARALPEHKSVFSHAPDPALPLSLSASPAGNGRAGHAPRTHSPSRVHECVRVCA